MCVRESTFILKTPSIPLCSCSMAAAMFTSRTFIFMLVILTAKTISAQLLYDCQNQCYQTYLQQYSTYCAWGQICKYTDTLAQKYLTCYEACDCGVGSNSSHKPSLRIIGGTFALTDELPWQALVFRDDTDFCGGIIIDKWHVLTAAHCIGQSGNYRVGVGSIDRMLAQAYYYETQSIVIHPRYNTPSHQENDIAILTLSRPLEFRPSVRPVCLPKQDARVSEAVLQCYVSGWGVTEVDGRSGSQYLKKVSVNIVNDTECSKSYLLNIGPERFCAGDMQKGGIDSCKGDSGGPLMCRQNSGDRYVLYGVVSVGRLCAQKQFPGIYTEVSNYITWIKDNL